MLRCSRNGCRKEFDVGSTEKCIHHLGSPVFHEGLKSWSCCADVNKPVLSFDEFMSIAGCTEVGQHSEDAPRPEVQKPAVSTKVPAVELNNQTEMFGVAPKPHQTLIKESPPSPPEPEEEDDLSTPAVPGAPCKRKGCGVTFVSDEVNRQGDGEGTVCVYHPKPPIFREGSKGYLCCKRRVLEFEEFLKIEGCKTGRHVFTSKPRNPVEEMTNCRIDHYQTPNAVHVSIFAKQVDKERSTVKFEQDTVIIDLFLPGTKRFHRALNLFGPVDPAGCSFQVLSSKVELNLQKQDTRSWIVLEKPTRDLGNINLIFGVGGRTGTVGAKQLVLDNGNKGGM
ncbi:hypothetical protein M378DRAFT_68757 [Amanita muscaria Koide BX008]|uniref:Uncharacterized protein n=1 Tax=Amanita muscaria (strain Koide BX008) TaxID=946122 RepID=A0A0C2XKM7_AMAMK|nr:hypothetical protein M378DRAFT_68757 [Amanita muscaria Koide BX008]